MQFNNKDDGSIKTTSIKADGRHFETNKSEAKHHGFSLMSQKSKSLDLNGGNSQNTTEEDGDVTDVELPPPMKIQEHSYPAVARPHITTDVESENTVRII